MVKAVPLSGLLSWFPHMASLYVHQVTFDPALFCLVAFAAAAAWYSWFRRSDAVLGFSAFLLMVLVGHLAPASVGWFNRYQAYLIVLGLFILARVARTGLFEHFIDGLRAGIAVAAAASVLVLLGVGAKQVSALVSTPQATRNIYEQQYQMGRLVEQQFPNDAVAANDIGIVSLRAAAPVVDLVVLGSTETLRLHRAGESTFSAAITDLLAEKQVKLIMIYPAWFDEKLYHSWHEVGSWTVSGTPVTIAGATVAFYTLDLPSQIEAQRRLRAFESQLPAGVRVEYAPLPVN